MLLKLNMRNDYVKYIDTGYLYILHQNKEIQVI